MQPPRAVREPAFCICRAALRYSTLVLTPDRSHASGQAEPFYAAQDRPFDAAQDRPFDAAQDRLRAVNGDGHFAHAR